MNALSHSKLGKIGSDGPRSYFLIPSRLSNNSPRCMGLRLRARQRRGRGNGLRLAYFFLLAGGSSPGSIVSVAIVIVLLAKSGGKSARTIRPT